MQDNDENPKASAEVEGHPERWSLKARIMRTLHLGKKKKGEAAKSPKSQSARRRRASDGGSTSARASSPPPTFTTAEEHVSPEAPADNNVANDADEPPPPLPPNKPKPRASMLGRIRRASHGATALFVPAATRDTQASDEKDEEKKEEDHHPKQMGGLQAFRNVLSGRRLQTYEAKPATGKPAAPASASSSTTEPPASAVVQSGTVKSLISQTNSKATEKGPPSGLKTSTSTPSLGNKSTKLQEAERVAGSSGRASTASKAPSSVRFDEQRASGSEKKGAGNFKLDDANDSVNAPSDRASIRNSNAKVKFHDQGNGKSPALVRQASAESDSSKKGSSDRGSRSLSLSRRLSKKQSTDGMGNEKGSRKSAKYKSTAGSDGLELSLHEQAFMPGDLLKRLGAAAGQLPPAPSVFAGQGAVLFVDVSGFTKLAERLNKEHVPVKASEKLANTITRVLEVLTQVCLDCGGEVGKFAGDALLCVWESKDLDKAELLARHCAVQMLEEMEQLNKIEKVELQIHGGVAKGSIVHFHFGSSDDDLRWYLISGEAVASATTLVDVALAGEFCCQDGVAKGLPQILDENDVSPRPEGRKGLKISKDGDTSNVFSSFRGMMSPASSSKKPNSQKDDDDAGPKHTKSLARGKKELPTTFLTTSSELPPQPDFPPEHSLVAAVLKDGLPRSCNVYIPSSLRDQLNERSEKKGEMRRRIASMFVEISSLVMTEDELLKQTVSDAKLDNLNSAFVTMTRIVHAFEGEVRDMLFDDKGCVYIAIFGAHCEEEKEHHPWNLLAVKAAMAIVNEIPSARVGVSIGTCFVGMAGVIERRTDFVVVGHEVNMSARYMSNARPGQVLVSSGIYGSTKEQIKYGPEIHIMVGKGEYAKQRTVYSPMEESLRRASFQASYRRSMGGGGQLVGRAQELQLIESTMNKITNGRSGVMVIEGPPGRGKSSIVTRAKRMGRGKIKVVSGQASSAERNSSYYTFRQVLEAYTGIRPAMTSIEARAVLEKLEQGRGEKVSIQALGQVLPWIADPSDSKKPAATAANTNEKAAAPPDRVAECFLQIIKLTFEKGSEKSALIVLEDVQWMDKDSLEMLSRLIDGLEKVQKVAILMTFRTETAESTNPAFEAMDIAVYDDDETARKVESQRKEIIATIKAKAKKLKFNSFWVELQCLARPEATKLASKLLGGEPNELSANKLWDQAKGDPFYLELLVQWLAEKNMIRPEKSGAISIVCDPSAFPKTTDELIQLRCSLLSEDHKRILQLAASGGEVFDAVYISALSKALAANDSKPNDVLSTDQVLGGLHAAADLELVAHVTDSTLRDEAQHKWRFKHDLIYRAVWLQISGPRRAILDKVAKTDRKKLALRLKSSFFDSQAE